MKPLLITLFILYFIQPADPLHSEDAGKDSLINLLENSTGAEKYEILLELTEKLYKKNPGQARDFAVEALAIADKDNDKNAV